MNIFSIFIMKCQNSITTQQILIPDMIIMQDMYGSGHLSIVLKKPDDAF